MVKHVTQLFKSRKQVEEIYNGSPEMFRKALKRLMRKGTVDDVYFVLSVDELTAPIVSLPYENIYTFDPPNIPNVIAHKCIAYESVIGAWYGQFPSILAAISNVSDMVIPDIVVGSSFFLNLYRVDVNGLDIIDNPTIVANRLDPLAHISKLVYIDEIPKQVLIKRLLVKNTTDLARLYYYPFRDKTYKELPYATSFVYE